MQAATLTVNDGKATPIAHNFEPQTTDGRKAVFVDRSSGIPAAYDRLTIETVEPKSATGGYRVLISLVRPQLETVAGIPTITHTDKVDVAFNSAQMSSLDKQKDNLALLANLLANSLVKDTVWNRASIY